MCQLERVRGDHMDAVLAFELPIGRTSQLCRLARADHGLRMLTAETTSRHRASQRVLEKAGFSATEACKVAGQPGIRFTLRLTASAPC